MSKLILSRSLFNRSPFTRAKLRAALGYLLVLLIVHGATAGAAHSHGRISPNLPGATAVSDADLTGSDTGLSQRRECSMCQFQRQLFGSLVDAPFFARTASVEIAFVSAQTVFYPSTLTTAPSGRAPPLASV
jgi:hypothetical protein